MKKNPRNKKPDPDPDHPSQRKIPPSKEVKRHGKDQELRGKLGEYLGNLRRPLVPMNPPDTLEEDIGNVQQPPPGVKHDSRLNRRNSGLAGMLNLFRYKP